MAKSVSKNGSRRDDYETPWAVVRWLEARFGAFDLDPCCSRSTKKAPRYISEQGNGLLRRWSGNVFMNPPWSQPLQSLFLYMARTEVRTGHADQVVGLIPSCNMDTIAWHDEILNCGAHELIIVRGRIHFLLDGEPRPNSSVPTAFPIWRGKRAPRSPKIFTVRASDLR
ncbi:MAG: DNA N-6-adenine-methyltransferase [Gammaproteobacteria bacterium]